MIRLENVSKIYHPSKNVRVVALDNVSLEIKTGEFVVILGKSGSGKSTLMYLVGLLESPTVGEVYIDQKRVSQMTDRHISNIRNKTVGFVFQQFNLIPNLTVTENVLLPSVYSSSGMTGHSLRAAENLLAIFDILDKKGAYPNQLSGGQQQRVAIARALINDPEVVIADEPTGNLDSKTGVQIMKLIQMVHKEKGKTIILVTHDREIARYGERVIELADGRIKRS